MAAADDFKILDDAVKNGKRSVTLPDGRTFTLTQARAERDRLRKEVEAQEAVTQSKQTQIDNAEKSVKNAQAILDAEIRAFNKNNASAAQVASAQLELQNRQEGYARLTSQTDEVLISRNLVLNTKAEDIRLKSQNVEAKTSGQKLVEKTEAPAPAVAAGATVKPKTVFTKTDVDKKLVELKLTDTPENRKTARQALKTTTPAVADTRWEAIFKTNYPQYNWMFTDLDRTKYSDVFDLFAKSVDVKTGKGIYTNEEFDKRWIGTSFYRELESSQKGRELSAAIGNFTWGSGNLAKFLTKAIQFGYKDENLKQQAYKELFSKVDGKYVNDLAVNEVRASTPYLALKDIGKQYFFDFADSQVEQVLAGTPNADGVAVSRDDLIRKARLAAKATYGHLSEQIDAGLTLEDLSASYKEKAAKLLELDPNTINFATDFSDALNYRKDGQPRVLSMSEWETELRTNDKYKYSFTKQANQDATDIGLSIARAFGKVQ